MHMGTTTVIEDATLLWSREFGLESCHQTSTGSTKNILGVMLLHPAGTTRLNVCLIIDRPLPCLNIPPISIWSRFPC